MKHIFQDALRLNISDEPILNLWMALFIKDQIALEKKKQKNVRVKAGSWGQDTSWYYGGKLLM